MFSRSSISSMSVATVVERYTCGLMSAARASARWAGKLSPPNRKFMTSAGRRNKAFVPLSFDGAITAARGEDAIEMIFSTSAGVSNGMSEGRISIDVAPFAVACFIASSRASFNLAPPSVMPTAPQVRANSNTFSSGDTTIDPSTELAL